MMDVRCWMLGSREFANPRLPDHIAQSHKMERAAPERLDACQASLGWLNLSDVQHLISHKLGEQTALQRTLTQLRQAINKAR